MSPDVVLPDYPPTGGRARGICARGNYVVDLLTHPRRLREASINGEPRRAIPLQEALDLTAERLRDPASRAAVAVVVDGNLPCEDILAAERLARSAIGTELFSVYLPPTDFDVLRGISATSAALIGREDLAKRDVILAIGDVMASHPVLGRDILDVRSARGNAFLMIDSVRSASAAFANSFLQVQPGCETTALAGIASAAGVELPGALGQIGPEEAARKSGASLSALAALASAVAGAKRLGVVVSAMPGRTASPAAVGFLAGVLAARKSGGVVAALTYGNAVGAYRLASATGARPLSDTLSACRQGKVKTLVVLGVDLLSAMSDTLERVESVVAALPFPGPLHARADVVLPIAMWFEQEGTVIDLGGAKSDLSAIAGPPRGALAARELVELLANRISPERPVDTELTAEHLVSRREEKLEEILAGWDAPLGPPLVGELILLPEPTSLAFADGSVSQWAKWAAVGSGEPTVAVNPRDAESIGVKEGQAVKVVLGRNVIGCFSRVTRDVPPGFASMPSDALWRGARITFGLDPTSGRIVLDPICMKISKDS